MQENKIDKLPILNTNEFDSDTETTPNSEINEKNQQTQMKEMPSPFPILESLPTISEMKNMKKLKKLKTKIVNGEIKGSEETKQFVHDRDWSIQQVCFLIGILNLVADICVKKPKKLQTKSLIFFTIEYVSFENTNYRIDVLVEKRINEIFDSFKEERSTSSNKRRFHFKIVEYIHVLLDILQKTRFEILTVDRKYNVTSKKKMVTGALIDGLDFSRQDIKIIGTKVHSIIMNEFQNHQKPNEFWLMKGNTEIMAALLSNY